ncbi:kinesin-like protein KIFC1 [Bombina bombina]|uniref:kinesin-like protein KIFC1 n=1 Tax=Bombina bombina TaxID=8345 RepID=UPI00235B2E43|nr:kinesin-like protein KIFC1 [Bombina bombina]
MENNGMDKKAQSMIKMGSRLPVLPRTKRSLNEENQDHSAKRFRSSPEAEPPVRRVAASIATTRPTAPVAAVLPKAQVIGRQSLAIGKTRNRVLGNNSAAVAGKPKAPLAAVQPHNTVAEKKRAPWDLKGQVNDMKAKVTNYRSKLANLSEEKTRLQCSEKELRSTVKVLSLEKSELSKELCTLETELKTLRQKLSSLESEVKVLSDLSSRQQVELSCQKCTVQELQDTNKCLTEKLQDREVTLQCAQEENSALRSINQSQSEEIARMKVSIEERDSQIHTLETERRRLHNLVQELKGNIRVFCRVRPSLKSEGGLPTDHIGYPNNDQKSIILSKTEESHIGRDKKDAMKYDFSFDCVFPPASSQSAVFEEISLLVQSALDGYPVCIFAYGQTSSGKTYTMEGPDHRSVETMGMIPRAINQIFNSAEDLKVKGWQYKFTASFLEIYNETIRDLLVTRPDKKQEYDIRRVSTSCNQVYVTNLRYVDVASVDEVHDLLQTAKSNRSVAKTALNDRSSRSHSVFQLKIEGENLRRDVRTSSVLSLIDLAGSERLDKSLSTGDRLRETQCINTSLSTLGQVITSLCNKESHIPYRNSKLTYLLQNSLGGNAKVLMFVNISPLEENFGESINSLRFASKVNECVIGTARANRK